MARPGKLGLEYFPHDVDMSGHEPIKYLEAAFGMVGYSIYCKLLEMIYRNGYYMLWHYRDSVIFVGERKIDRNRVLTVDEFEDILDFMVTEGLFDQRLFERYSVLTSIGIQSRFLKGAERRKELFLIREYWLLPRISADVRNRDRILFVDRYATEAITANEKSGDEMNDGEQGRKKVLSLPAPSVDAPSKVEIPMPEIPQARYVRDIEDDGKRDETFFRSVILPYWRINRPGNYLPADLEREFTDYWREHGPMRLLWAMREFITRNHKDPKLIGEALRGEFNFYNKEDRARRGGFKSSVSSSDIMRRNRSGGSVAGGSRYGGRKSDI